MFAYIEDILHHYVDNIGVNDSNNAILTSISRQCKKGVALTDRQYNLVKSKLLDQADLLKENHVDNLLDCLEPRLPLRQIDRSKFIKIVTHAAMMGDKPYESYKDKYNWILIRFPFSKKDMVTVENVVREAIQEKNKRKDYYHVRGSHEHYFLLNAFNAYAIVKQFQNRNFEIQEEIVNLYQSVKVIVDNKENHIPMVASNKVINLKKSCVDIIEQELGVYNEETNILYKDRSIRFGYDYSNFTQDGSCTSAIVNRTQPDVLLDPKKYTINDIVESVVLLNRFPLLVLIDQESPATQLLEIHKAFKYIVSPSEQSVLFRIDNNDEDNNHLNEYIKEQSLNNWVDSNTKIVYIKKNKLPKALISSVFKPIAAFSKTSMRNNMQVDAFVNFNCDLVMYHDDQKNLFGKWTRKYGIV